MAGYLKKIIIRILGFILDKFRMIYISYKNQKISKIVGGSIAWPFDVRGAQNISIHPTSSIGTSACLFATRAKIIIKEHVITGPGLTIITGDHQYLPERYLDSIKDEEKSVECDADVIIESDVWLGANVTILKGVHIGCSAIVAAGALVKDNVPDFAIVGGVPAKVLKYKWDESARKRHRDFLNQAERNVK